MQNQIPINSNSSRHLVVRLDKRDVVIALIFPVKCNRQMDVNPKVFPVLQIEPDRAFCHQQIDIDRYTFVQRAGYVANGDPDNGNIDTNLTFIQIYIARYLSTQSECLTISARARNYLEGSEAPLYSLGTFGLLEDIRQLYLVRPKSVWRVLVQIN